MKLILTLLLIVGCSTVEPEKKSHYDLCVYVEGGWECDMCYYDRTLNKNRRFCPKDPIGVDIVD